jgi:methyltransferase (TIGR00027 family)
MALFRALESARPAGRRLFEDRLARAFVSPRLRPVVALAAIPGVAALVHRYIDRRWPGARSSAVARTRFIDERLRAAVAAGVRQVLLLGAGFDARAHRLLGSDGVVVFEVDHPDTQARKRAGVEATLGAAAAHVRYVPVDFNETTLDACMAHAGFDLGRRSFILWEGVTNYLTATVVDVTLRWCARAAAGSQVVFTYVHRDVLDRPESFAGTTRLRATLAAAGEPWTFGLEPAELPAYLAARGLALDEDVGAADYRRTYLGAVAGRIRGYEFYRIVRAHVPA